MVPALLMRLARFLRNLTTKLINRIRTTQRSPQTVWVLDPDALTEELHDPAMRQFYTDHLESCLAMPSRQRQ